jgi:octanoyl-[GcvH]:protein N-octanoyltransferase
VVVTDSPLLRSALEPVYEALELDWDPATAASVEDEAPGIDLDAVEEALLTELRTRYELLDGDLDRATLDLARKLEAAHTAADR